MESARTRRWGAGIATIAISAVAMSLVAIAGCSSSAHPAASTTSDSTTAPALAGDGDEGSGGSGSAAATTAAATTPDDAPVPASGAPTTADGPCPWIPTQTAADTEGNRIGRVVVTTQAGVTIGCEFHFDTNWGADRITMTITRVQYPTEVAAYNAMVAASQAGTDAIGVPAIAAGVDAVLYRTALYPPDGNRDWACAFAPGQSVVTVKTDQVDPSDDALNVAKAIVGQF